MKYSVFLYLFFLFLILLILCFFLQNKPYLPKTVWIYWDSEEVPTMIQQIQRHNSLRLLAWNVHFLNRRTVYSYIPRSTFPETYANLSVQHKSDWIRLYLLTHYGGCWLDASIILNDLSLDTIWQNSVDKASVFTAFATGPETYVHSSGKVMPLVIDNWFIMAPQGSDILRRWLNEYTSAIQMGFLEYKRKARKEGVDLHAIQFNGEEDVYLTEHICIQKVIQKDIQQIPPMILLHSSDSMLKIHEECKWDAGCIESRLLHPSAKRLPYIKLTSSERNLKLSSYF